MLIDICREHFACDGKCDDALLHLVSALQLARAVKSGSLPELFLFVNWPHDRSALAIPAASGTPILRKLAQIIGFHHTQLLVATEVSTLDAEYSGCCILGGAREAQARHSASFGGSTTHNRLALWLAPALARTIS